MTNTIILQAANVPALAFVVDHNGQRVRTEWNCGYPELPDNLARNNIEAREAALYFDANGILDLKKWLVIRQEREALHRECEAKLDALLSDADKAVGPAPQCYATPTLEGRTFSEKPTPQSEPMDHADIFIAYRKWAESPNAYLSKSNGKACPPAILAYIEHDKTRGEYLKAHGFADLEAQADKWNGLAYQARQAVTLCPTQTLPDIIAKFSALCEDLQGDLTPREDSAMRTMQDELTALKDFEL